MNSILLEGNLVRDPEFKMTPRGTSLCTFSVASNRYLKQENGSQQEVSFFDVETWSSLAELCSQKLGKGRGVRVVGRLKQERWVDQEGKNHSRVKIVAEHVELRQQVKKDSEKEKNSAAADSYQSGHFSMEEKEVVNF